MGVASQYYMDVVIGLAAWLQLLYKAPLNLHSYNHLI